MFSSKSKRIVIIKTGETFPEIKKSHGDFDDWMVSNMGVSKESVEVFDIYKNSVLPLPEYCLGVIVTGSHSHVTDHEVWSENLACWIASLIERDIPFFGICYGHQMLAYAMGGAVGYLSGGAEIGSVAIELTSAAASDDLFLGMPASFQAQETHYQAVLQVPEGAVILATSTRDRHQAIRFGSCAWGVQFHPEFSSEIEAAYIDQQSGLLTDAGFDVALLKSQVVDCDYSSSLLKRFVEIVFSRQAPQCEICGGYYVCRRWHGCCRFI